MAKETKNINGEEILSYSVTQNVPAGVMYQIIFICPTCGTKNVWLYYGMDANSIYIRCQECANDGEFVYLGKLMSGDCLYVDEDVSNLYIRWRTQPISRKRKPGLFKGVLLGDRQDVWDNNGYSSSMEVKLSPEEAERFRKSAIANKKYPNIQKAKMFLEGSAVDLLANLRCPRCNRVGVDVERNIYMNKIFVACDGCSLTGSMSDRRAYKRRSPRNFGEFWNMFDWQNWNLNAGITPDGIPKARVQAMEIDGDDQEEETPVDNPYAMEVDID